MFLEIYLSFQSLSKIIHLKWSILSGLVFPEQICLLFSYWKNDIVKIVNEVTHI